jgi:hypothetical protein
MSLGALSTKAMLAVSDYLRRHPEEMLRAAKNAASLKVGVPVSALLWIARELGGDKVPADLHLEARSPGIYARASFEMMDTPLRGGANIIIQSLDLRPDALLIELRLEDITLEVTRSNVGTPVAALLQSGVLDLSRPGDLLAYMPKKSAMIIETRGNVITLDLMRHPKLSADRARKLVGLILPFLSVETIRTDGVHLDVALSPFPGGPAEALSRLRKAW